MTRAAQHSVWHPAFVPRWGYVGVLQTFAACFALLGDRRQAVDLLNRCGPYASEYPWAYFGRYTEMIDRARAGKPLFDKRRKR